MKTKKDIENKLKYILEQIKETENDIEIAIENDEECSDDFKYLQNLERDKKMLEWVLN